MSGLATQPQQTSNVSPGDDPLRDDDGLDDGDLLADTDDSPEVSATGNGKGGTGGVGLTGGMEAALTDAAEAADGRLEDDGDADALMPDTLNELDDPICFGSGGTEDDDDKSDDAALAADAALAGEVGPTLAGERTLNEEALTDTDDEEDDSPSTPMGRGKPGKEELLAEGKGRGGTQQITDTP